mgnify:CR=1 FL=1
MILSEILFEEILFKEIDDFLHHWLHLVVAVDEQRIVGSPGIGQPFNQE